MMGKTKIMNQHPQNDKYAKLQGAPDLKNENACLRGLAHGLNESEGDRVSGSNPTTANIFLLLFI